MARADKVWQFILHRCETVAIVPFCFEGRNLTKEYVASERPIHRTTRCCPARALPQAVGPGAEPSAVNERARPFGDYSESRISSCFAPTTTQSLQQQKRDSTRMHLPIGTKTGLLSGLLCATTW